MENDSEHIYGRFITWKDFLPGKASGFNTVIGVLFLIGGTLEGIQLFEEA